MSGADELPAPTAAPAVVGRSARLAEGEAGVEISCSPESDETCGVEADLGPVDHATLGTLAFYYDRISDASIKEVALELRRGAAASRVSFVNDSSYLPGGRWLAAHASEWPSAGGSEPLRIRQLIYQAPPNGARARFGRLTARAEGRPTVVLTFDDVTAETHTNAFPLMAQRGFRGTCYVPPRLVGRDNRMSLAHLQELYAAGWDMGCNSSDDSAFTAFPDTAAALADLTSVRSFLVDAGMSRAQDHWCWPYGDFTRELADAFRSAGFLTGRTVNPDTFHDHLGLGPGVAATLPSRGFNPSIGLDAATVLIDQALRRGSTAFFHFHDISASPTRIGWSLDRFTALLDLLAAKSARGEVDVLTVSEWYARIPKLPV